MEIHILGDAWATGPQGKRVSLERKKAALLAYLALEKSASRSELADRLWPEAGESTARNNLRQILKRLRGQLGQECVENEERLRLCEGLPMDVLQLCAAHKAEEHARVASFEGELLQGLTFDDCPDLSHWLDEWRRHLRDMRFGAMERLVLQWETEGQLAKALEGAQRLRVMEPHSENAYRHLMRLYYLKGDRAAALETSRQCREMMMRELGALPSDETRELAHAIENAEAARQLPSPRVGPVIPLAVSRPPLLAGREYEWGLMEDAWAARKPMFVEGEPGIGKSRLVTEFAAAKVGKGRWLLLDARPGDRQQAFSTHMRSLGTVLRHVPSARPQGRVRRELSRVIPHLEKKPLPLPSSPEEQSEFFAAVMQFLRVALRDIELLIFDDGQYMDDASTALGVRVHGEFREEMEAGRFPLIINVFRTSESQDAWARQMLQGAVSSGLVQWVPMTRLDAEAVRLMLRGMGDPRLEPIAEEMMAHTGGNPLFIVETVRHLLRSESFDGAFPSSLPPSGRVMAIIQQRLDSLSKEALQVAQVFAVARTDFDFRMVREVLGISTAQFEKLWQQLVEAHIVHGRWFFHDVVGEVVLASLSEPRREELSARFEDYRRRHS
ncbi:BTAD domain-containing putative transcriptional regulator [Hyalangium versicolor]|uniref:BTAD domain-containing putative transcriptional regulator n=1 Tax=Hyalangium versicolor TaxID=2861190 RepID=UPI001CCCB36F|nr:BTAD domain-containing putative transcriptional regulator [Hyalangium versicolor]